MIYTGMFPGNLEICVALCTLDHKAINSLLPFWHLWWLTVEDNWDSTSYHVHLGYHWSPPVWWFLTECTSSYITDKHQHFFTVSEFKFYQICKRLLLYCTTYEFMLQSKRTLRENIQQNKKLLLYIQYNIMKSKRV